jgi:Xaa-Pro aminopeptidase
MKAAFFTHNRRQLIEKLQGGIAVFSAYAQMQRGNDMAFQFEQEANFWWLTGIEYPDWILIIDGTKGSSHQVLVSHTRSSTAVCLLSLLRK